MRPAAHATRGSKRTNTLMLMAFPIAWPMCFAGTPDFKILLRYSVDQPCKRAKSDNVVILFCVVM